MRFAQDVFRSALFDDASVPQDEDAIGDGADEGEVVGDEAEADTVLFFAAADNLFADLHEKTVHTDHEIKHIILQCDSVTVLDTGGIHALTRFVQHMLPHQQLYMCNIQFQPLRTIVKSGSLPEIQKITFTSDLTEALNKIREFEGIEVK